jgi:CDP-paratose 2-epimerase
VLAGYGGSPEYLIHTNLTGCFHCLEIARRAKADFLFVSTSRVYPVALINSLAWDETETRYALRTEQTLPGASQQGIREDFPLDGARSLYGMTKLAGELMVTEYGDAYGVRFVIDRCGLLTGPWQMAKSDQGVIALWVAAHAFNRSLKYIGFGGSGKQVRDFLHIDDFCDLVLDQIVHFAVRDACQRDPVDHARVAVVEPRKRSAVALARRFHKPPVSGICALGRVDHGLTRHAAGKCVNSAPI